MNLKNTKNIKKTSKNWQPEASLGGLVFTLGAKFSKYGKKFFNREGLQKISYSRALILNLLSEGPASQTELSQKLKQKKTSMGETLARLENLGYLQANPAPDDGRKKLWSLTSKGKNIYLKTRQTMKFHGQEIDAVLQKYQVSLKEIETTKKVLRILDHGLYAEDES